MQDQHDSREREKVVEMAGSYQEEAVRLDVEKMVQGCDEDLAEHLAWRIEEESHSAARLEKHGKPVLTVESIAVVAMAENVAHVVAGETLAPFPREAARKSSRVCVVLPEEHIAVTVVVAVMKTAVAEG